MKQQTLSKKDIKELNKELKQLYGIEEFFDKSNSVFMLDDEYVMSEDIILFFYHENKLVPTLHLLLKQNFLKKVEVNMGAVPFVVKGADIMRPGIVGVDPDVKEGDLVAVVDETHNKPLAVGESLFSKEEMIEMEAGKMVLNIHHVGDQVWNLSK
ncbi:TPA: DUF1947 domain-containing protein [Candidatus Woesearchaeota archaeon]|nr:DUF1947 domain-containing protein [Candidatus Woesearchaeota archaeon]